MVKGEQGFPILSARPHPTPFFVSVPCRAPPDTAHSPIFLGWGLAEGSWRELESPERGSYQRMKTS